MFELKKTIRGTVAAFWDLGKMLLGRDPCYIPVVGTPGTFSFLSTEECWDGYQAIIPEESKWDNRVPARVLFKLAFYNPTRSASDITCPVLLIAGEHDSPRAPLAPLPPLRAILRHLMILTPTRVLPRGTADFLRAPEWGLGGPWRPRVPPLGGHERSTPRCRGNGAVSHS